MTFYQELQLDQAGSKNYIATFEKPKEKFIHILIFIFKVLLNLIFSIAVVTIFSLIFGSENSIAGLVVLLGISVFRFSNLDIKPSHSVPTIFLIFSILALGPKAANLVPVGCDFLINFACILLIVLLGCHNANLFNHATLVLSYLLLQSYDVSGFSYVKRLICLFVGAILTALVLYRNTRKKTFEFTFKDLFADFSLSKARCRWQIKIAFCVAGAVLISTLAGFQKPVWAGIAAMSVTAPRGEVRSRMQGRIFGNVIGNVLFVTAVFILPEKLMSYLSMLGGIGLGLSAKYRAQTAWNAFSAVSIAVSVFGLADTVGYRILNNIFGALFAFLCGYLIENVLLEINGLIHKNELTYEPVDLIQAEV